MKKRMLIIILAVFVLWACDGVNAPAADEPRITSFMFPAAENFSLSSNVIAVISGYDITAQLPYGTDLSDLLPRFELSTDAVSTPQSGARNNFSRPAIYTVSNPEGSITVIYTVRLSNAESE